MFFEPIAIVGQSCTLPDAPSPEALWANVLAGKDSVGAVPAGRWELAAATAMGTPANWLDRTWSDRGGYVRDFDSHFDASGFSISADEVRALDPVFRLTLHGVREAIRSAGGVDAKKTGLVLGNLSFPSAGLARFAESVWHQRAGLPELPRPHARNRFSSGLPAHLAAKALSLEAGAFALDAACASSLYAIKLACDRLHARTADVMVAGAVNAADDLFIHIGFCALSAMSKTGQSRPFHRDADGLVPAEGAGFVVLRRLSDAVAAKQKVLGVIRGVGLSNDGRGRGLLAPSEEGQERAMRRAYAQSGLSPRDITLVECHATGTPVGDGTEIRSMARVFEGVKTVPIGSLKSNLGHLITAAGVAGVLKVLGAMKHGQRPPTLHADATIDALKGTPFRVLNAAEAWTGPRRAAVSAFGFGGNNAHILLESFEDHRTFAAVSAPAPKRAPIAIVGMGARVGRGDSARDFADALLSARPDANARETVKVSIDGLKFPPKDLQAALAQQTLVLEAAREAVRGLTLPRDTTSVLVGMGCDPEVARYGARWRLSTRVGDEKAADATWLAAAKDSFTPVLQAAGVLGTMPNIPANRLNSQLDLAGPAFTVSAEEASGLAALNLAVHALRVGEIDAAVVGAVDASKEPVHEEALSALGVRRHSGDAAVVVTLKRLDDAQKAGDQVYAVIDDDAGAGGTALAFGTTGNGFSLEPLVGSAHAASGLLHVAAAALALKHRAAPRLDGPAMPHFGASQASVDISVLEAPSASVRLSTPPAVTPWLADAPASLHVFAGATRADVIRALTNRTPSAQGAARAVIVAASSDELAQRCDAAARWIQNGGPVPEGAAFSEAPIGGELAFVFTGGAAAYPGMGREISLAFPQQVDAVAARCSEFQSATSWIYGPGDGQPKHPLDQLWGTSYVCQLHAEISQRLLGLKPTATIGYSSGESNALFAMGVWNDLGAMMAESRKGPIFNSLLVGNFDAPRAVWARAGVQGDGWANFVVSAPVAQVRAALAKEPLAHLTIINTPDECVIGGERAACQRVVEAIGSSRALPLGYQMAVHVPEVEEIRDGWWALHRRETKTVPGVRFYTNATGTSFTPTSETAADAITGQALTTMDFPRVVLNAWNDGVRVFVEHGPRGLCTNWIRTILGDKPHLAVSLDASGRGGVRQLLNATAWLVSAGVDVNASALEAHLAAARPPLPPPGNTVTFPAHPPAPKLPTGASPVSVTPPAADLNVMARAPRLTPILDEAAAASAGANSREFPRATAQLARASTPNVEAAPVAAKPALHSHIAASASPMAAAPTSHVHAPAQAVYMASAPTSYAHVSSATSAQVPAPAAIAAQLNAAELQGPLAQLVAYQAQVAQAHRAFLEQQAAMHERFMAIHNASHATLMRAAGATPTSLPPVPARPVFAPPPPAPLMSARPVPAHTNGAVATAPETASLPKPPPPAPRVVEAPVVKQQPALKPGPKFDRKQLEILAGGKISTVFGPQFAGQDGYARQVRMPEPPLLLADRVTGIDAAPGSMGTGTLWTETDVRRDAWYINDEGRMPAGVMIESGQADLLLISWLGVDSLNKGERVYRLLGCELTYSGGLPQPGDTLAYDIHVDGHANQGDVRLFFFHYDCTVNGKPRLKVRHGQAGFFTDEELANSAGVLWNPEDEKPAPAKVDPPLVTCTKTKFSPSELAAFADGRPLACFGPGWELTQAHVRSPKITAKKMQFLHEVTEFNPTGGPWGRGYLRAETPVTPNDWFFEGHFKNDPCMPGTLMFEGCLQAMSIYLAGLGFTIERDSWRFEPVPDTKYPMRCRGQVTPQSKHLVYEVFVSEVSAGPIPTVWADLLCTVDGRKAFHAKRVGLQLVPDWPMETWKHQRPAASQLTGELVPLQQLSGLLNYTEPKPVAVVDGFAFDYHSLLACAWGPPSSAFGPFYARFDGTRRAARLPGPPYHFMSRITKLDGPIGGMKAGTTVEVEYDLPVEQWYFEQNGHATMPFCVLMEAALQPCGWLASYVGSALTTDVDLLFRNLDGTGTQTIDILPGAGTFRTKVKLLSISQSAGMIIESFDVECFIGDTRVFDMKTVFGFFPKEAFENQVGLPASEPERARLAAKSDYLVDLTTRPAKYCEGTLRLAGEMLLMLDRVTGFWPEGGEKKLGYLRAEKTVDVDEWFFKAHFFQDPVQPGSLGIEAITQLLQFFMLEKGMGQGLKNPRFEPIMLGTPITWKYRGQVTPKNTLIGSEIQITEIGEDAKGRYVIAEGWLWVDKKRIYHAKNVGMRIVEGPPPSPQKPPEPKREATTSSSSEDVLDPSRDTWLSDHRPTWTLPALPMMSMVDRLAGAVERETRLAVTGISGMQVRRWLPFPGDALRVQTEVERDGDAHAATFSAWRESADKSLSRFEPVASGMVHTTPPPPAPAPLRPLADAVAAPNPYASGALFHGPAFHYLTELKLGSTGASATLRAEAGTVPHGTWNQGVLDAATHAIPHDALSMWSPNISSNVVGYPYRLSWLHRYEPLPTSGPVQLEVRFAGFDGDPRFPSFDVQLLVEGRVAVAFRLVEVLLPKGPIGQAPREARRRFLRDRQFTEGVALSSFDGTTTTLTQRALRESDWLPGNLSRIYGVPPSKRAELLRLVAEKEHVSRRAFVHPALVTVDERGARADVRPLRLHPLEVAATETEVQVRDAAPPVQDLSTVRAYWSARFGVGSWPVEDVYYGLIQRFVGDVVLADPDAFARVHGRSCLYVGNHQVGIESLMFSVIMSALSGTPTVTLAKAEHRTSWLGTLIQQCFSYPGVVDPRVITYFDRDDKAALLGIVSELGEEMRTAGKNVMVHVEGTRSLNCREPVVKMSSAFIDMALAVGAPIVPVRFVGGLPVQPLTERIEFPVGYGAQDIWVGAPIMPETISALPLKQRKDVVLAAMNALGPPLTEEVPLAPKPDFAAAVNEWHQRTGASVEDSTLFVTLALSKTLQPDAAALVEAARLGHLHVGADAKHQWLGRLAQRLFGPKGPRITGLAT